VLKNRTAPATATETAPAPAPARATETDTATATDTGPVPATGPAGTAPVGAPTREGAGPGWLLVDFCGEEHELGDHGRLSFGRAADLVLEDDPYLHRTVGEFVAVDGHWWLHNTGNRTTLTVRDRAGSHLVVVGPGGAAALLPGEQSVTFSSGPHRYEIEVVLERPEPFVDEPGDLSGELADPLAERTLEWGKVPLNDDQRLLLVALCEPLLRDPAAVDVVLATNRAAAATLGWTLTKLNRKLDHLCLKLARAGVGGLHGDVAVLAADRRRRLVEHAVEVGLVTAEDLSLLAPPDPVSN
jgi:hypothetical protein